MRVAQLVGFLVVETYHPGSSFRLGIGPRIFMNLFQDWTDAYLPVLGDVPRDSEASEIEDLSVQYLGGNAHRGTVACVYWYVCIDRDEYVCVYERLQYCVLEKKIVLKF